MRSHRSVVSLNDFTTTTVPFSSDPFSGPVRIFVSMALPKGTVPFFWHPCHKNRDSPPFPPRCATRWVYHKFRALGQMAIRRLLRHAQRRAGSVLVGNNVPIPWIGSRDSRRARLLPSQETADRAGSAGASPSLWSCHSGWLVPCLSGPRKAHSPDAAANRRHGWLVLRLLTVPAGSLVPFSAEQLHHAPAALAGDIDPTRASHLKRPPSGWEWIRGRGKEL